YLPLGAVIAGRRVQEPFWSRPGTPFRHGFTYSGHPTACAAGLANLTVMRRERLVERVSEFESVLGAAVEPLAELALVSGGRSGPAGPRAGGQPRAGAAPRSRQAGRGHRPRGRPPRARHPPGFGPAAPPRAVPAATGRRPARRCGARPGPEPPDACTRAAPA